MTTAGATWAAARSAARVPATSAEEARAAAARATVTTAGAAWVAARSAARVAVARVVMDGGGGNGDGGHGGGEGGGGGGLK